jgi:hypothetical protein
VSLPNRWRHADRWTKVVRCLSQYLVSLRPDRRSCVRADDDRLDSSSLLLDLPTVHLTSARNDGNRTFICRRHIDRSSSYRYRMTNHSAGTRIRHYLNHTAYASISSLVHEPAKHDTRETGKMPFPSDSPGDRTKRRKERMPSTSLLILSADG